MKNLLNLLIGALIIGIFNGSTSCKKNNDSPSYETGTVTDVEGNVYKTVKIGDQWWMAENLRTTKFRTGEAIPNVTNNTEWAALTTPAYCSYNNTVSANIYGLLYNWYATDLAGNGNKNICPEGWHIPSDSELLVLINNLGGISLAGGKMKESGTTNWSSPNTGATNSSGFTALPSGFRSYTNGAFEYIRVFGHFWSCTEGNAAQAWNIGLFNIEASVNHSTSVKSLGFSIRCVKD